MDFKLSNNPFKFGRPIQNPKDFAGREEILQRITMDMVNLQNVSLYGERRTGKTSLLLYLAQPKSDTAIELPETHIPVYINFQEFSKAKAISVWQAIADAIAEQIKQRHPDRENEANRFLYITGELHPTPDEPELFGTRFGRAFSVLENSGFNFHLMFDEFEQTKKNPELGDSFYDTLRSLPTRASNISYIIATRTGLAALQPENTKISSPLFNIFTTITLRPFQEDEVFRLIFDYFARAGLDISLAENLCNVSTFLYDVTGYHPFFFQILCSNLYTKLTDPDWPLGKAKEEALQAFKREAKDHFQYYWDRSSEKERDVIQKLAQSQISDKDLSEIVPQINSLRDRCLIVQTTESEHRWRLFSSAFDEWVIQQTISPVIDKPSWITPFPKPQPIPYQSRINDILRGYNPFPNHIAEYELAHLFGKGGGFWSQHPTYITITSNFTPEAILTESGGGKTAFAYALRQIGDKEGNLLDRTLPIVITGDNLTLKNTQNQFANALLNFVHTNPARLLGLNRASTEFVVRMLVNDLDVALVKVRLAQVSEADKDFGKIVEKVSKLSQQKQLHWLRQAKQCLELLGFNQALLAVDFNRQNIQSIKTWLRNAQRWADHSIIAKLFLPKVTQQDFAESLGRIKTLELTWSEQQLAQMVEWRFESLNRLARTRVSPEILFDEDLYPEFIQHAQGNPRRLARLWRYLFEDHLNNSPNRMTFTAENLARAVENLK